jgi:hypothetical protein
LNLDIVQEENQQENGYAKKKERRIVIPSGAFLVIEEMYDYPANQHVERKSKQKKPETLSVKQRNSQKIKRELVRKSNAFSTKRGEQIANTWYHLRFQLVCI